MSAKAPERTADLSIETAKLPGSQVELKIGVPQKEVDAAYERALGRLAQRAKIEGFRPGKAPRALVEARIGPEALKDEVIEALVPKLVSEALESEQIEPIDRPRVSEVDLERGRAGSLVAKVSVMPEIKLADLDSLKVERTTTELTPELVERRLEELRGRLAEIEPVEREVRLGDVIVADMDVEVDGKEVPSEARRAMEAEVKEGVLIPELVAALAGKQVGETAEAEIQLAEDHVDPELRGKQARLRMTVRGVKEKRVPELTDELATQLSNGEQTSVLAFRGAVRADLEENAKRLDELNFEQAVLKAAVDGSELEVPQSLVEHEVGHRLEEMEKRLQAQGLRLERYFEYLGQSPEQWLAEAMPEAEARLKVDLVLEEIGRKEGIDPTNEEILAHMQEEATRDQELADHFTEMVASRSARDYFKHRLARLQILERLVQRASGTYQPATAAKAPAGEQGGEADA